MKEEELKNSLERRIGRSVPPECWEHLRDEGWIAECLSASYITYTEKEFLLDAKEELEKLQKYDQRKREREARESTKADDQPYTQESHPGANLGGKSTAARADALYAYDALAGGGKSSGRSVLSGAFFSRGGGDGTLAQWVFILQAEMWVPPDEVASFYQSARQYLKVDHPAPKSTESLEVAAFVWLQRLEARKRKEKEPSIAEIYRRWNEKFKGEPVRKFKDYRDFTRYFKRGNEAAFRGFDGESREKLYEWVSRGGGKSAFEAWAFRMSATFDSASPEPESAWDE